MNDARWGLVGQPADPDVAPTTGRNRRPAYRQPFLELQVIKPARAGLSSRLGNRWGRAVVRQRCRGERDERRPGRVTPGDNRKPTRKRDRTDWHWWRRRRDYPRR